MTTIVIIVLILVVLAAVGIFFFMSFSKGGAGTNESISAANQSIGNLATIAGNFFRTN